MRRPLDAYYTPEPLAERLTGLLAPLFGAGDVVLEPHAGGGAFVKALARQTRGTGVKILAMDIDPQAPVFEAPPQGVETLPGMDFLSFQTERRISGVIGNPPFNQAEAHVRHALALKPLVAGFLLRLAFLESQGREAFWEEHPPATVFVLTRRPSFTGGGTDNAAYGFFVWLDRVNTTELVFLTGSHNQ